MYGYVVYLVIIEVEITCLVYNLANARVELHRNKPKFTVI